MIITSRRSNTPSLNNGIHHSLLAPQPEPQIHDKNTDPEPDPNTPYEPSKVNESIQSKTKGTQSPIQPNTQRMPKCSIGY